MMGHSLTVDVPPEIYDQLQRRAALMQRTIEDEFVLALAATMPDDSNLPGNVATMLASFTTSNTMNE